MELREALTQVGEIRAHMARAETFRGYRSASVGLSGLIAIFGAWFQTSWAPDPQHDVSAYLTLWFVLAAVSLVLPGLELGHRSFFADSPLTRKATRLAVGQFLPCLVAGGLLTWTMARFASEGLWLLPGLWSVVFSLGIFASCQLLPKPVFWIGVYYLIAGLAVLAFARGEAAFSPWAMVATFGVGQLLAAGVLHFQLERDRGR